MHVTRSIIFAQTINHGNTCFFQLHCLLIFKFEIVKIHTIYAVIFEGRKFHGFCYKLVEHKILILNKEAVA